MFLPGERLLKTTWQADREERREVFFYLFYNTASENENVGCVEVN